MASNLMGMASNPMEKAVEAKNALHRCADVISTLGPVGLQNGLHILDNCSSTLNQNSDFGDSC